MKTLTDYITIVAIMLLNTFTIYLIWNNIIIDIFNAPELTYCMMAKK